ncbi:hypothetical protein [Paracoccus aerodenitrificans]|uniref:hypothetical protein n=1 Tax=Paracoccus aerodenitrificans TaxID=3017781 RepID=UPI0022F10A17|nr:hypothetical protein [Paracoccus aerodenitrificans]
MAIYCYVLSRRLRRLNDLETGLGGAIAVMTSEISRLDQATRRARDEAQIASKELTRTLEAARKEKAYWALQSSLAMNAPQAARRLRPRKAAQELSDA